jgi:hypothetical protein
MAAPTREGGTSTSLQLAWTPPADNGGCALAGYAAFMDDGSGTGSFTEVNAAADPAIRG